MLPREGRAGHWGLKGTRERVVGTEARVVDLAHQNDWCAEADDETTADFAAESPGIAPLAHARGLDLIDGVGASNTICRQINALCGKMAKHGTAAFVDGRNVAQVKPDWFSLGKRLNTAGLDRLDALAGQRAIHRDCCACRGKTRPSGGQSAGRTSGEIPFICLVLSLQVKHLRGNRQCYGL